MPSRYLPALPPLGALQQHALPSLPTLAPSPPLPPPHHYVCSPSTPTPTPIATATATANAHATATHHISTPSAVTTIAYPHFDSCNSFDTTAAASFTPLPYDPVLIQPHRSQPQNHSPPPQHTVSQPFQQSLSRSHSLLNPLPNSLPYAVPNSHPFVHAPLTTTSPQANTISPLSPNPPYKSSPLCISPLSSTPPAPPYPGTVPDQYNVSCAATPPPPPVGMTAARIDDSLIARLRGFSDRAMLASASTVSAAPREAQIRDTSETLVMPYQPVVQHHGMPATGGFSGSCVGQDGTSGTGGTVYDDEGGGASTVGQGDRPHACRKCSATFRRRDNLMAHIRAQHKGERPFKCELCGFRFIKKDHAMKHWKVVHLKERPFVCSRCNSRFGQRSDLNKHVRSVHLRIKPFECEHCGLRFSHRGNQIRHQAVVHEKRKPYVCSECDSSFAEKSNLVKHCQAVHKKYVFGLESEGRTGL